MMRKQAARLALAIAVLALAACASTPQAQAPAAVAACIDCGRIVHVETVATGNATAGATLGGIVGSVASKSLPGSYDYRIHVQMDNGQRTSVLRDELDGLETGQRVRVAGGRIVLLP